MQPEVEVREADFGIDEEYARLRGEPGSTGACVLFTGLVREWADGAQALELEHYPGMTEASIAAIVRDARARWQLEVARARAAAELGALPRGVRGVRVHHGLPEDAGPDLEEGNRHGRCVLG